MQLNGKIELLMLNIKNKDEVKKYHLTSQNKWEILKSEKKCVSPMLNLDFYLVCLFKTKMSSGAFPYWSKRKILIKRKTNPLCMNLNR